MVALWLEIYYIRLTTYTPAVLFTCASGCRPWLQVVLPHLCFDDQDAELWEEDPQEFVRKVGCEQGSSNSGQMMLGSTTSAMLPC